MKYFVKCRNQHKSVESTEGIPLFMELMNLQNVSVPVLEEKLFKWDSLDTE